MMIVAASGCSGRNSSGSGMGSSQSRLITHNGFTENGLSTNGFTENGFTENGFTENGFTENGFTENGFTENGFTENGFTENGLSTMQIMESDPNAVEFVRYAYSCAMRPDQHMILPINGEDVTFDGQLGLAPEWGQEGGTCNDACKKWVSACLLARTNAYGAHVEISLRAPRSLFLANGDTDSYNRTQYLELSTSSDPSLDEPTLFPMREGAYFGNIFATAATPDNTLINAPKYYACAGPGSNIPQLTKRFCSSQGDGCLVFTGDPSSTTVNPQPILSSWDTCTSEKPACAGVDAAPNQAVHDCTGADGVVYTEVLTVYLKKPLTVCGNHVCEHSVPSQIYAPGAVMEDATNCPDDCHPGTWATNVDLHEIRCTIPGRCFEATQFGQSVDFGRRLAVRPDDTVVRGLDFIPGSLGGIDFGTETGSLPPNNKSILAGYRTDGTPDFSQFISIDPALSTIDPTLPTLLRAVTSDKDGNIVVANSSPLWVGKLDPAGTMLWIQDFPNVIEGIAGPVVTDGAGDVILAYDPQSAAANQTRVTKLNAADGGFQWDIALDPISTATDLTFGSMGVDTSGNVHFIDIGNLYRISPTGSVLFTRGTTEFDAAAAAIATKALAAIVAPLGVRFTGIATDKNGFAYVGGITGSAADFGTGTLVGPGGFVVKFAPNGDVDGSFPPFFVAGDVIPVSVHLDVDGNLIVGGGFVGDGTAPDFGAHAFDSWGSPDSFLTARRPSDGGFIWAKQLSLVTAGGTDALAVGHAGQVFVSGGFDGSMLFDDQQLINTNPEIVGNQNLFVGAFNAPCGTPGCDLVAPLFLASSVPGPTAAIGNPITVYATSQAGAVVYYQRPLAKNAAGDTHFDGVNVVCLPRSGSTFAIGVTTVHCTATDPHANTSTTSFPVTVLGTAGPVLLNVPPDTTIDATSPAGAVVTYSPPTAIDQIDGPVPVTCTPASGSQFAVGTTTVTCSAADLATPPNVTHAKFTVTVKIQGQPTITVPSPGPLVDATSPAGAVVTYQASAKDALGNTIPVSCVPPSGSVFPLGATTVTCTAEDASGNKATATFTVQVHYRWTGFLPPINNNGSSKFSLGSSVPVKFRLSSGITTAVANLFLAPVTNGVPGAEQPAVSSGGANQGNLFRYDTCGRIYIYDLSTSNLSKGVWQLRVDLHDGLSHAVNITLR